MEVDAFLADSVVTAEGKLYVQGGAWNQLTVGSFPTRHPRMGVALAISVPFGANEREHTFMLHLEDADGQRLALHPGQSEVSGTFNVARSPAVTDGDEQVVALAINLDGLVFQSPGRYRYVVTIDGVPRKHLPFQISQGPRI